MQLLAVHFMHLFLISTNPEGQLKQFDGDFAEHCLQFPTHG